MTVPLRKDSPEIEDLTTADLARANTRADLSTTERADGRSKPVVSDRSTDISARRDGPAVVEATPLFPDDQLQDLKSRWDQIQTSFVDEPRSAVQQADGLVASTMQHLASAFATERTNLEQQWDRGDNVSTEELRVAFQRYRSFFRRLLSL
jgi:hypothetical protein